MTPASITKRTCAAKPSSYCRDDLDLFDRVDPLGIAREVADHRGHAVDGRMNLDRLRRGIRHARRLPRWTDIPDHRAEPPRPSGPTTIRQVPVLASVSARVQPLAVTARVIMLALVAALTLIRHQGVGGSCGWIALLAGRRACPPSSRPTTGSSAPLGRFAEVVVTGLAAGSIAAVADRTGTVDAGFGAEAVLPYLAVPLLTAALRRRPTEGAALLGVAAVVAGGRRHPARRRTARSPSRATSPPAGSGWCSARSSRSRPTPCASSCSRPSPTPQPYAEATRLLTQLRSVARSLPGATLDPGSISEHLLEELRLVAPGDRAAVLSTSGGGRLVVLAQTGADRVDWETTLDSESAIAEAWTTQQPQVASRSQARSHHRRRRLLAGRPAGRRGTHDRAGDPRGGRRRARTRQPSSSR